MKFKTTFVATAATLLLACFSTAATAVTFDEIMAGIRAAREAEARVLVQRENEFREKMEEQERLYNEALRRRNEAEALSNRLSNQYDANEIRIDELNALLTVNQGNLGELFGVTRQIAGDAAGVLANSLNNTQIITPPGAESRVEFLRRIAAATALPSIIELENLWLDLMSEMQADGEVARYTAPVLQEDGVTTVPTEVVRVGSFGAVGNGEYLTYLASEGMLSVLSRQPSDRALMALARNLQSNTGTSYVRAMVDPARGTLLGMFVERPSPIERIVEGEVVVYVIVGVGLLGALLAVLQYFYLFYTKFSVKAQLAKLGKPLKNNPLGRLLLSATSSSGKPSDETPEVVELRISEALLREMPSLERFQSFLRLAVAAGPLLGLIGTVIGMIITFKSITASGSSDPKLMAEGIGQAMIATVLGLGVAIPLLFLNSGLVSLSRSIINVLEEQSTRLMAARLEASENA